MRVVVVDDSAIVREGVSRLLADRSIEVCGVASDGQGALALVRSERPDAVILDIRMPPTYTNEGLQAAEAIRAAHPETGVLVLSQHVDSGYALRLVDGVHVGSGYLLKDRVTDAEVLIDALERIVAGENVVDSQLIASLLEQRSVSGPTDELSSRELEVLGLMAEGLTDRAIAERLWLSEKTVETHVRHILSKLDLPAGAPYNRRVQAVLIYLDRA